MLKQLLFLNYFIGTFSICFSQSVFDLKPSKQSKLKESNQFCQILDSIAFESIIDELLMRFKHNDRNGYKENLVLNYSLNYNCLNIPKQLMLKRQILSFQTSLDYNDLNSNYIFALSIKNGNDNVQDLLELVNKVACFEENELRTYFCLLNYNYVRNHKLINSRTDLLLRYIYFQDQLYRIGCYKYKLYNYEFVKENDRLMQDLFEKKALTESKYYMFSDTYYQMTFDLLLIHSVTDDISCFFENNFKVYSEGFANNFETIDSLKLLIDLYLKFKYNKQFFNTVYGEGKVSGSFWGKLPKLNAEELKLIIQYLNLTVQDLSFQ